MTFDTGFRSVRSWDESSVANRSTKSERSVLSAERKLMEQHLLRKSSSEEIKEMLDGNSPSRSQSPFAKAIRSLSPIGLKAPSFRASSVLRKRSKSPAPKLQELSSDSSVISEELRDSAKDVRNLSGASDDPRNVSGEMKKATVDRIVSALGEVIAGAKESKRELDLGTITMSISFSDPGGSEEPVRATLPHQFPGLSIVGLDQVRGSSMNRSKSPVPSAVSDPSTAADTAVASNLSIDRRKSRKPTVSQRLSLKNRSSKKEDKKRLKKRDKKRRALLERAKRLDKAAAEDGSFDDSVASGSYQEDIEGSLMTAFLDLIDPPRYEERSDNEEDTSYEDSSDSGSSVSGRSATLDAIADLLFLQGDEMVTPPRKRSGRRSPKRRSKSNPLLKNLKDEPNIISAFMESKGVKVNKKPKSKSKREDLEDPTGCALIFEESFFDVLSRFVDKADQKMLFCAGELCGEMDDVQSVAATSVAGTVEQGYKNFEQSLDDLVNNLDASDENSGTKLKAIRVLKELKAEYPNLYERLMSKLGETMLKKEAVSGTSTTDATGDISNITHSLSTLSNATAEVDAELEEINKGHGEAAGHDRSESKQNKDSSSQLMSLWKRATSPLGTSSRPTSPLSLASLLGPRKSPPVNQTPVTTNKSKKGLEEDSHLLDSNTLATSLESEVAASRTLSLMDDNSDEAPAPESGVKRLLKAARKSPITLPKLGSFKRPKTPNQTPVITNKTKRMSSYDFEPHFVEETAKENDAAATNSSQTELRIQYPDYIITHTADDASVLSAPEPYPEWQDFGSSPFKETSENRSKLPRSVRSVKRGGAGNKVKRSEQKKLMEKQDSSDFNSGIEKMGEWEEFSSSPFAPSEPISIGTKGQVAQASSPLKAREAAHAALRRFSTSKVESNKLRSPSNADVAETGATSMYTQGDMEFDMFDHGMYSKSYL